MRLFKYKFRYSVPDTENQSWGKRKGLIQFCDDHLSTDDVNKKISEFLKRENPQINIHVVVIKQIQIL